MRESYIVCIAMNKLQRRETGIIDVDREKISATTDPLGKKLFTTTKIKSKVSFPILKPW